MRDYVRGKGWVGAKDGEPVDPTTGQQHVFQQVNCPECKERITVEVLGVPLAADAGPRQPDKCGEPAASFIPRWGMYFTCVLPKGHEGEHRQGGTCFKHGEYVGEKCQKWPDCIAPPVPQEAAPARKLALSEIPGSLLNDGITEVEVAANRAGLSDASGLAERKIRQRFGKHGDLARIDDILAALIREAGSKRERELEDGLKHVLRCSDGSPHTCTKCAEASRILERK